MVVAEHIIEFYKNIRVPNLQGLQVDVLTPYNDPAVMVIMEEFYRKYFNDNTTRIMLIGINPGRFGGGVTGIPFTDPINLQKYCGIENPFQKKHELSSKFIYDMIDDFGGPEAFYHKFCFYSVSPVGFTKGGKNYNYYDDKGLKQRIESFVVESMNAHLNMGFSREVAFSLGQRTNVKELQDLNGKYNFFKNIIPLPHPRWVMQYRLKKKNEFIGEYIDKLCSVIP